MSVLAFDANDPWIVVLGVVVAFATLDSLAGTRLLPRFVMAIWHNNVADPLSRRQSRRDTIQRDEIRKEIVADIQTQLRAALKEQLQTPNGKPNFTDMTVRFDDLEHGVGSVRAAQLMQAERLQEVARVGRATATKLDDHMAHTNEFIAEQSSLGTSSEKGTIDRRDL